MAKEIWMRVNCEKDSLSRTPFKMHRKIKVTGTYRQQIPTSLTNRINELIMEEEYIKKTWEKYITVIRYQQE